MWNQQGGIAKSTGARFSISSHFRHYIEAGSTNPKVNRWDIFATELEAAFGGSDRIIRASGRLLGLKMKEASRAHRYSPRMNLVGLKMFTINFIEKAFQTISRASGPNRVHLPTSMTLFARHKEPTIVTGNASMRKRNPNRLNSLHMTKSKRL